MQRFGQLIAAARERRGLLGKDLAPRVGLGPSTLSDYENGTRKNLPDVGVLDALQRELGVPKRAMLEAWGYLDPVRDGDPGMITLSADDPLAEIVAALRAADPATVQTVRALVAVLGSQVPVRPSQDRSA